MTVMMLMTMKALTIKRRGVWACCPDLTRCCAAMDPYKVLGVPASQVKHPSDIDKVRQRAKKLYKRFAAEKNKFQAKKVMEAFEMVQRNMKKIGEGAYKLLGRGRKERELDRHFNHQTKEIKKDRRVKRHLTKARRGEVHGEKRMHLPGDKERIPTFRRSKKRRRHKMAKIKKPNVDVLQGLERIAAVLPQRTKFPKVVKLLYRWTKEYMNVDNREYIFRVLNDVTKLPFLAEDSEGRQDVICVFEYVLSYNSLWFKEDEKRQMLGRAWQLATVTFCQCFTDDAFTLSSTIAKLNEAFALIEKSKPEIDAYLEEKQKRAAKHEAKVEASKLEAKMEAKLEEKIEAKEEDDKQVNGKKAKLALPVEPAPAVSNGKHQPVDPKQEDGSDHEDFFGVGAAGADDDDETSEEEECSDDEELSDEEKEPKSKESSIDVDEIESSSEAEAEMCHRLNSGSSVSFYLSEYSQAVKPTLEEPAPHNSPPRDPGAHAPVRNCTGAPGTTSRSESSALALLLSKRRLLRTGILAVLLSFVVKLIKTDADIAALLLKEKRKSCQEMSAFVFPVPCTEESLITIRRSPRQHAVSALPGKDFVERCLFTLFKNRGPLWARNKVDTFFQVGADIAYLGTKHEQSELDEHGVSNAIATIITISASEPAGTGNRFSKDMWAEQTFKTGEHKVGEANNILESGRWGFLCFALRVCYQIMRFILVHVSETFYIV
ncbi:hypothetical protein AK812_SmicGene5849 [Symbiodinium microadriaticum]|uniref:J domain-containing protein n=1 Tax=Symbiodinium microadriaticum TaxID=2951 RepID=A0A1Q9ESS9_SYMMI|nr:hypothetical protein AK812_SmicGene5849 [Symbiodinium microadriaticum]